MERLRLKIKGIVQGVGFRPWVHRMTGDFSLRGYIRNSSSGVELELEGKRGDLEGFLEALRLSPPPLALIESVESEYSRELKGFEGFEIRRSLREEKRATLISPDVAICPDCLRELNEPADRRWRYPFINCTNCGPRFTIIKDVPYDRPLTSMGDFPMCESCEREYNDISDRRYHAQPDCCESCGPELEFISGEDRRRGEDALQAARALLKKGGILAVKGLGGFHLACLAEDEALVHTLRHRKQRDEKPFALMCADLEAAESFCNITQGQRELLLSPQRPIVLLKKRGGQSLHHLSENGWLGVMLPYTPMHYLLLGGDIKALVMTSANLSDKPIMYKDQEALKELSGIADGFLFHNREIVTRCDDSLCWEIGGAAYFARRSRGYVPYPVSAPGSGSGILACGAEQKASFCMSREDQVFPSQHIGDLKNMETLENYESQVLHFQRLFDIKPHTIACDMHPDYMSTSYARQRAEGEGLHLVPVQHHHAHMASCMADNALEGELIGLVWDGVGYGSDGTAWGAECLVGGYRGFERVASIRPIPLIGGDRAVKEISRIGFALMQESGCEVSGFENRTFYENMLKNGMNCPLSSGMGRLFDGVAAILGIKEKCSYEGQGAVLLEAEAAEDEKGFYPFALDGELPRFDWREMIRALCGEKAEGMDVSRLAAKFMNTLVEMAVSQCRLAREKRGLDRVCLSGGSFQNMYILSRLTARLEEEGFRVYRHRRVSTNDEGLSLGQLMVAAALTGEDGYERGL